MRCPEEQGYNGNRLTLWLKCADNTVELDAPYRFQLGGGTAPKEGVPRDGVVERTGQHLIEYHSEYVVIRFTEGATAKDTFAALKTLRHSSEPNTYNRLWDCRNVKLDAPLWELLRSANHIRATETTGRLAMLADTDYQFAFCRMYLPLRTSDKVAAKAFRTEAAAIDWLAGNRNVR